LGFLAFPLSILIGYSTIVTPPHGGGDSWGLGRAATAFLISGAIVVGGAISSVISLARREQLVGLGILALILNAIPAAIVLFVISGGMDR
jgi:hypothetical protein